MEGERERERERERIRERERSWFECVNKRQKMLQAERGQTILRLIYVFVCTEAVTITVCVS